MDLLQAQDSFQQPLADRLRPKKFEDFFDQGLISQNHSWLRQAVKAGRIPHLILWGPPGTGKTSFARLLKETPGYEFLLVNAMDLGAKEIKAVCEDAEKKKQLYQQRTLFFVDEIHRLNKAQQDVLLPYIERGSVTFVGATTENPQYEVNRALLSRVRILKFDLLSRQGLQSLAERAFQDLDLSCEKILKLESFSALLDFADGDGRRLLNAIELVVDLFQSQTQTQSSSPPSTSSPISFPLSEESLRQILGYHWVAFDKQGTQFYDLLSALIKSLRGSDPDAALYYMLRCLKGGMDPLVLCRRMIVFASEDIGNADPRALSVALDVFRAAEVIGPPEAEINMAQAVTYLASAPKSNRSYVALNQARQFVEKHGSALAPAHLRSEQYLYPHDEPKGWVMQNYWPSGIKAPSFYEPSTHGFEKNILQYRQWLKSNPSETKD